MLTTCVPCCTPADETPLIASHGVVGVDMDVLMSIKGAWLVVRKHANKWVYLKCEGRCTWVALTTPPQEMIRQLSPRFDDAVIATSSSSDISSYMHSLKDLATNHQHFIKATTMNADIQIICIMLPENIQKAAARHDGASVALYNTKRVMDEKGLIHRCFGEQGIFHIVDTGGTTDNSALIYSKLARHVQNLTGPYRFSKCLVDSHRNILLYYDGQWSRTSKSDAALQFVEGNFNNELVDNDNNDIVPFGVISAAAWGTAARTAKMRFIDVDSLDTKKRRHLIQTAATTRIYDVKSSAEVRVGERHSLFKHANNVCIKSLTSNGRIVNLWQSSNEVQAKERIFDWIFS